MEPGAEVKSTFFVSKNFRNYKIEVIRQKQQQTYQSYRFQPKVIDANRITESFQTAQYSVDKNWIRKDIYNEFVSQYVALR